MSSYIDMVVEDLGSIRIAIPDTVEAEEEILGSQGEDGELLGLKEEVSERAEAVKAALSHLSESAFQELSNTVIVFGRGLRRKIGHMSESVRPSSISVEFGIGITAEAGIVITQYGGEGNFKIKLSWDIDDD